MIIEKDGRSFSQRTDEEIEKLLKEDIEVLTKEERETLELMLAELQGNDKVAANSPSLLSTIKDLEFKHQPVDIETFIYDPYYLGETCSNLYKPYIEDLKELFNGGYTQAVLSGAVGIGKCLLGDTEVFDAIAGRRRRVDEIGEFETTTMIEDSNQLKTSFAKAFPSGKKDCVRLTLKSGQSVGLSKDHKVFTQRGWIEASNLLSNDLIAAPRRLPSPSIYTKKTRHELLTTIYCNNNSLEVGVIKREDGVSLFRRLPSEYYGLSNEDIKILLNYIWSNSGYIGSDEVLLACDCEGLIDDLRYLLLRLGVVSKKTEHIRTRRDIANKGKEEKAWKLSISDPIHVVKFFTEIGHISTYYTESENCLNLCKKNIINNDELSGDIYFDGIDSVKEIGFHDVYDLSVPETKNFIANLIVVHNTYFCSIGVIRVLYEISCLRDPHKSFGLAPGTDISIVAFSVTEELAISVILECNSNWPKRTNCKSLNSLVS